MSQYDTHGKSAFNREVLLTGARVFGILFSIAIPMYLGRKLTVETYGTYKQLMLFFWFAHVGLNLGLDDSAYFFLRKNPKNFPLYSFNALIFNLIVTSILWIFLTIFKNEIASLIGNPELAQYLPLLGYLTLATVSSMQIEGMLIVGLNRFNERLFVEVGTELFKSVAIIGGFYFFNSVSMALVFMSVLMSLRLIGVIIIIHKCKESENLSYKEAPAHFISQAKFGLPLGISRILQNILNVENFFISSFFSLVQFTYYTVGCFENPLVNAARTSMFELANIGMTDAMKNDDKKKAIEIWRSMTRKLFLIVVPFVMYMMFFSSEIITFIFSDKYSASIPFFRIFNLYLFVGALNPEPLFRAASETFLALKMRVVGVFIGVLLFVGGALWGGPLLALAGKILGVFIMNIIGLVLGARLFKSNVIHLFQWKDFAKVTLVSLVLSLSLRLIFINILWNPFWILALSFSLYVLIHFLLSCGVGLIRDDEILYLKSILSRVFGRFGQVFLSLP